MSESATRCRNQKNWKEAQRLGLYVVEAVNNSVREGDINTVSSVSNLASTYMYSGQLEEAEKYFSGTRDDLPVA